MPAPAVTKAAIQRAIEATKAAGLTPSAVTVSKDGTVRVVENPVMHPHAKARIQSYQPPAQTVQPWWFGNPAFKGTSFFLHGLPPLQATNRLTPPAKGTEEHKRWSAVHRASPGPNRWKMRSATYPGIASAAAQQWGDHALQVTA
jgi:hypothetical protein